MHTFEIGQEVRAKIPLIDDLTEHGMGRQLLAEPGELLIIRGIRPSGRAFDVSHPTVKDKSFRVSYDEIEPVQTTTEVTHAPSS